jgi:catechol 2,3-dioxygenase-like lactoylglutathione lyase family enzyme
MNGSGRGFPFLDPEISTALDGEPRPPRALHYLHSERLEGLLVEGAAASLVTYSQGQVIDEGKRHGQRTPSILERDLRGTFLNPGARRSDNRTGVGRVTLQRMDNVGIVVESLDAAISFFAELGLELEGRATIEGDWAERVTGLRDMRVEIAMMRTPDGHSRLEISRFLTPPAVADHRNAPVNALGYLRIMFAVEDIDDTLARLSPHGAELVGELAQYEDKYRLCYVRGPEGILIGLAEQIG